MIQEVELKHKEITGKILRAFFKIAYPQLGYGFLEKVYENAMVIAKRLTAENEALLLNYLRATPYEVGLVFIFGPKPDFRRKAFDNSRKSIAWE